jgi:molybdopterin converting factor small subunit
MEHEVLVLATAVLKLPFGIGGARGPAEFHCAGATIGEALADCISREPRLRSRIFLDDGTLWVSVFLNGRSVGHQQALDQTLGEGDEIRIVPPIAGG